jgi:DeoR/GlpR family transcriptional regulator of sugar metabolism
VRATRAVSVGELEERYGVSPMTARRDLAELERQSAVRRTHGGAVLPGVSTHEDSFEQRVETDEPAKRALAAEAAKLVNARETIFLDSSSTTYYLAREIVDAGVQVTILTNSLPIMELVARQSSGDVELVGIGGSLRRLTSSFVGPSATTSVKTHFADRVFFSIKGITPDGVLTDADLLEAEVKRAMVGQSASAFLLVDGSKLTTQGLNAILPIEQVQNVVVHGVDPASLGVLGSPRLTLHFAQGGVA